MKNKLSYANGSSTSLEEKSKKFCKSEEDLNVKNIELATTSFKGYAFQERELYILVPI